uniref:Protein sleepless n=1 Tax=Panagrolaimus sp. PS1159 TaxID=55785 RepID=A0AC35FSN0_9BILA
MEDDMDFKTIPVSQCPYKDNCVKISASNQGISFVIRGCESQVYRPSTKSQDIPCTSNSSPSVCRCPDTLCNNSMQYFYNSILLFLAIIFNTQR